NTTTSSNDNNIPNTPSSRNNSATTSSDQLPKEVTRLYFILSARNCPNIGHFISPSIQIYDETSPQVQLCNYSLQTTANSQAVIMCLVARSFEGSWEIIPVGRLSSGNAGNYNPIKTTILDLENNI
ncbi:12005_t:CDS:2, partial [Racocetra persica]